MKVRRAGAMVAAVVIAVIVMQGLMACTREPAGMGEQAIPVELRDEAASAYRAALAAVNDPTPEAAVGMAATVCRTAYRTDDGRPSWAQDFDGGVPERGTRSVAAVKEARRAGVTALYMTVVERWEHDPHGETADGQVERTVTVQLLGVREDGTNGVCLAGVDTARVWPYGPDRPRGVAR